MSTRTQMNRSEVTKKIKQDLKNRTGLTWSVTGDRGTAWGWLKINAPKSRRVSHKANPNFDRNLPSYEQDELPWIECEPEEGQEAYNTSQTDREILAEALGIGMNFSSCQGVSISPDSWDFYMDRAENGPPPPEPVEELEIPEWALEPTPEAPQDVEAKEEIEEIFVEVKNPKLNKNCHIEEYLSQLDNEDDYRLERAKVTHNANLSTQQYDDLVNGNLLTDLEWLASKGGCGSTADLRDVNDFSEYTEEERQLWIDHSFIKTVKITAPDRQIIYIDPQGHRYARYVAFSIEPEMKEAKSEVAEPDQADETESAVIVNMAKALLQTQTAGEVLNILIGSGLERVKALEIMMVIV